MTRTHDALALFSAGLDSILAAKTVQAQGLRVKCLHFLSPFFGKDEAEVERLRAVHGLDIDAVDISDDFAAMMARGPRYGYGKFLNPCVDCKILMLRKAKELLGRYGAKFIISGEVVGQRPMSQRRDAMNSIRRDAEVADLLLRPLCARNLDPTPMERSGLVDRERLHDCYGRGRKGQMRLAEEYGLTEIPTPAGGCRLAEMESARRYWPVLSKSLAAGRAPSAEEFRLADTGRQYWLDGYWLSMGRNKDDNAVLAALAGPGDLVFDVAGFPGPLAVGRRIPDAGAWDEAVLAEAAALVASFSPKAVRSQGPVDVAVTRGDQTRTLAVTPSREPRLGWAEPAWEVTGDDKAALPVLDGE